MIQISNLKIIKKLHKMEHVNDRKFLMRTENRERQEVSSKSNECKTQVKLN